MASNILHGCPGCGGTTILTGSDHGDTLRTCSRCGKSIRHSPPSLPPGFHGMRMFGPQEVLSNEFEGEGNSEPSRNNQDRTFP